jgi:acetyl-CoA carboxylase biotin carboxyl carrier protein
MPRDLSYNDVLDILKIVDGVGEGCELRVDVGDFHLHFTKEGVSGTPVAATLAPVVGRQAPPSPPSAAPVAPETVSVAAPVEAASPVATKSREGLVDVRSPMIGTFYRKPAPDKPPFVEVGQSVAPDAPVCLVEVMKLFNTIQAGTAGTIEEICVDDATMVQAGQVLMRIAPSGAR